jgi:UDP:flavonoid glycosyltransferase YjiC (YdhE family)
MTQKAITIFTAGTLGDHLPIFQLGKQLSQHGHRVRLAVNSSMGSYADQTGLEVIRLTNVEGGEAEAQEHAAAWDFWKPNNAHSSDIDQKGMVRKTTQQIRELVYCCRESDLFISTTIRPHGFIVSAITRVPWISISMNPNAFVTPAFPQDNLLLLERMNNEYSELAPGILSMIQSLGSEIPTPPFTRSWLWAPLVLLASSPVFYRSDPNMLLPQSHLRQTGFLFYEEKNWQNWQPDNELRQFCMPSNPEEIPLVLAFSSQPLENPATILQNHALAAKLLGKRLLVQKGWAGFSKEMLPESIDRTSVLFRDFLPQNWLFSHTCCAIQHGGIGSIARAFLQACPLLIEPFGNDQFFNANRVHELGVGAVLNPFTSTPEKIARAISDILREPHVRKKLGILSEKLQKEDGAENASRLIDEYLERNPSDREQRIWNYPPIHHENEIWRQVHTERKPS